MCFTIFSFEPRTPFSRYNSALVAEAKLSAIENHSCIVANAAKENLHNMESKQLSMD